MRSFTSIALLLFSQINPISLSFLFISPLCQCQYVQGAGGVIRLRHKNSDLPQAVYQPFHDDPFFLFLPIPGNGV